MEIVIHGMTFEAWEKELARMMRAARVRKDPTQPFDYWQAGYTPKAACLDMFPEVHEEALSNELILQEAGFLPCT